MKTKQNDTTPSSLYNKMSEIDIKSGKITFGQRIELGKIFQGDDTEIVKFEKVFLCMHDFKPAMTEYTKLTDYFNRIIRGITYWIEQEQTLLKYDPSPEELNAGIKDLSDKIGEFGTIKALAKNYGKDPDEVLKWEYGKVFGILYSDLEEYKYQQRFNKVLEQKYKR
ncbi:MAG: hypothetical protein BGO29_14840 [Bacteroidales bacterium 36-12]|nr:MAG: hypothetical protein BGO29_14840 [Bacteroidales bacterium 36-12]